MKNREVAKYAAMTVFLLANALCRAGGNIDPHEGFAWAENTGWMNFATGDSGAVLSPSTLSGFVWSESIGWIKLAAENSTYENTTHANWGVKIVGTTLTGYAWAENAGWINFAPTGGGVSFLGARRLDGYAWSENVGWIHLRGVAVDHSAYGVSTAVSGATLILLR
jgi:hypothetical protein